MSDDLLYNLPYSTEFLVKRAYESLSKREKKKNKFIEPQVIGKDRKTFITNFEAFCNSINREKSFVKIYLDKETLFPSSLIGDLTQLKIDTSLKAAHVKNILTIFIKMYVLCQDCKSSDTHLVKKNRSTFISCSMCKSERVFTFN